MSNITVTVEKENEEHQLKKGCIRLTEVGGADSTHYNPTSRRHQCSTL